ncbi:MAG: dioxygenase [Actinobacteria bacterium]|nr:dioxygenase [Actinomycetota bacterium]
MALHRLTTITLGVPDVAATAAFYRDFGLVETEPATFATRDGGEQLRLAPAPRRRLLELGLGAHDADDLARISSALTRLGSEAVAGPTELRAVEPVTDTVVRVAVAPPIEAPVAATPATNRPGIVERHNARADGIERPEPVRPRKLGHVVLGSPDQAATQRFFTEGLGLKVSDEIAGIAAFLRCSTDHHNLLVQDAPVPYVHHTSWQVDDVDDVGRGAKAMLDADPSRHVWGLGRHYIGSNFFWYLRDPAGNFAEYYADMDVIDDDDTWAPTAIADLRALYAWGPPVPSSFLAPDDLAELTT